jgi:EAL domain-containing protein (putative c-di-GMP-specific phosphodiesterase class I)
MDSSNRISDVIEAINEGRIKVAFQPIFSTKSYKVAKYEMLIRMLSPNDDVIPPNLFLPFIRNTRVYTTLTKVVLDKAVATLLSTDYHLSLNLDLQDILNDDIIALFTTAFEDEKSLAQRITIEILEHEEIQDFENIKERIQCLKSLGFSIALDDFGSGYANFRYLIDLDLDILKIDGTIIKNIDTDKGAYSVVKSVISLAKEMDMKVVAEQIETKEELETLLKLNVDYLQGYYLGRPSFTFTSSVLVL